MLQTVLGYFFITAIGLLLLLALAIPIATELSKLTWRVSFDRTFKILTMVVGVATAILLLFFIW